MNTNFNFRKFARILSSSKFWACVFSVLLTVSCAPKGSKKKSASVIKDCVLPDEQVNSLQGKWSTTPIKVSFKSGDWSSDESLAMMESGNTWNTFFNASKGFSIFEINGATSNLVQTLPSCGSSTLSDGTVIYKRASGWTKSPSAIAVTTTCFNSSTTGGLAVISNAIMEVNYANFFVSGTGRLPDLQSIVVHELGHLLGLDHSCGPLGKPNQTLPNVACPDVNSDPDNPLVQAVMFPQVFFDSAGNGEQKRDLQDNDEGRANCIYD